MPTGWQLGFRGKNIYGPYEKKKRFRLQYFKDTAYKFSDGLGGDKFIEAGGMKNHPGKWIGIKWAGLPPAKQ